MQMNQLFSNHSIFSLFAPTVVSSLAFTCSTVSSLRTQQHVNSCHVLNSLLPPHSAASQNNSDDDHVTDYYQYIPGNKLTLTSSLDNYLQTFIKHYINQAAQKHVNCQLSERYTSI